VRLEVTEAVVNHLSGSGAGVVGIYQRHDWAEEKRSALDVCSPSCRGGSQAACRKGVAIAGSGRDVAKAVRCWASGFGHFFARSRTRSRPIVPSNRLLPLRPLARLAQVQGPRRAGSEA
jgi:hypothetical protein